MEKEIFKLLDEIKKRPGLYLGSNSITKLHIFLGGYYFCKHSFGIEISSQDKIWFMFQRWIERKYSIRISQSWASIISFIW